MIGTAKSGKTPKCCFAGTYRSRPPQETWERVVPLLGRFGVTRIADITGLDRIGIPVAIAIRPLSRSIAVAAGKGADLVSAKVSAAMEAVECAHAEAINLPLVLASRAEVLRSRRAAALDSLPRLAGQVVDDDSRLLWVEGRDIMAGTEVMLPYELVHAHYAPPSLPGAAAFQATTNGLASGNAVAEAICHGLFEVIERDGFNLWSRLPAAQKSERLVDLASIGDPVAMAALQRLTQAGFEIAVWDIASDLEVPAYHCMIVDAADPAGHPGTGSGCHRDNGVALTRALFEAVQVRGTYISGGRDDLPRREYELTHMQSFRQIVARSGPDVKPTRPYAALASTVAEYFEDDIEWVAVRLRSAGVGPVVVVDLSQPGTGIAVVRVVVPGLEGPPGDDSQPGTRALGLSP